MDVREAVHTQPMKPSQIAAIAICIIIAMVDGYAILVIAFVAPSLAKAWSMGLSKSAISLARASSVLPSAPFSCRRLRRSCQVGRETGFDQAARIALNEGSFLCSSQPV